MRRLPTADSIVEIGRKSRTLTVVIGKQNLAGYSARNLKGLIAHLLALLGNSSDQAAIVVIRKHILISGSKSS